MLKRLSLSLVAVLEQCFAAHVTPATPPGAGRQ